MNTVVLPQLPWHGTKELKLSLPDTWQPEYYNMAGWNKPALKPEGIRTSVTKPIGTAPIRELARGKKDVVIIFDDMARATRVSGIVPFVLEELAAAGIPENRIRFVCALGCHGTHDRLGFEKKLGQDVLSRYPVYNHNAFSECTYVGTTKTFGTKVHINKEVMSCDFKIAIGMVAPHPASGFGGGGKIIMPGVASFESIEHNHRSTLENALKQKDSPVIGMGVFDKNPMRIDIEEAAIMSGLDVMINCIVNMWGETTSVYAGALQPAYEAAVNEAASHYKTPKPNGEPLVIANTFIKANEAIAVGLGTAFGATRPNGGDVILIANAPDGQVTHYLLGTFGKKNPGTLGFRLKVPPHVNRVCIFSQYPDVAGRDYIEKSEKVVFKRKWEDVLEELRHSYGSDVKVAVYPSADVQYSC